MRAVITVTLNPAIDRTVWIDRLVPGSTHRTAETRATIGGKGINVARTVAQSGVPVFALGIAGEDQVMPIQTDLSSLGVPSRFLATPGETRTNLKLIERTNGRMTEINGSGPTVTAALVEALESDLLSVVERMRVAAVVLAGSLPIGIDPAIYARWTSLLRELDRSIAVLADSSDEALAAVVAAEPWLVKPNRAEAEVLVGHAIEDVEDARIAAGEIGRLGPRGVLLSLGAQGAVACWDGATELLPAQTIESPLGHLLTTVGAGDAMVARVAIELARRELSSGIDAESFFDMCREAVAQAARQISASAGLASERLTDAFSRDGVPADAARTTA